MILGLESSTLIKHIQDLKSSHSKAEKYYHNFSLEVHYIFSNIWIHIDTPGFDLDLNVVIRKELPKEGSLLLCNE